MKAAGGRTESDFGEELVDERARRRTQPLAEGLAGRAEDPRGGAETGMAGRQARSPSKTKAAAAGRCRGGGPRGERRDHRRQGGRGGRRTRADPHGTTLTVTGGELPAAQG